MKKTILISIAASLLTMMQFISFASATTCQISDLTLSTNCQTGTTNNDFLNPLQVNSDLMFSFADWEFAQKWDHDQDMITDELIDLMLNISPKLGSADSGTEGNWSVTSNIWDLYSNVMIVMKGGNADYIGYLIASDETSGMYSSPFINVNNGNLKDISHWSLYVRGSGGVTVSEPSLFFLFIIGFMGFAIVRR